MKQFKFFLTVLLLTISVLGFSQKVKFKKEFVLVDDVQTYKFTEEGTITSLQTLNSNEFISIIGTFYDAPNPARKSPNGHHFPATIRRVVYTVKFLESGKELYTDLSVKDIVKAIYNSKMVDEQGKIDEEKSNIFINKYNNDNLKYKLIN